MLSAAHSSPLVAALARHYHQLVAHVRHHAARWGGDGSAAHDVVHDVCVELIEAPPASPVQTPLAFLRSVATRRAIDRHRADAARAARIAVPGEVPDAAASEASDPARIVAGRQDVQLLVRAIDGLPIRCREVFVLHKIHEMPRSEVAAHLGISLKTVEKHLRLGVAASLASMRQP